jgi:hypothetical protein
MRAREFLLEYNKDVTLKNLGTAIYDRLRREGPSWWERLGINAQYFENPSATAAHNVSYTVLDMLEKTDPTKNKQYVQWLARTYVRDSAHLEDVLTQLGPVLSKFYQLVQRKKLTPPHNDINRYKDFHDLGSAVESQPDVSANDTNVEKGQAKDYYRDNDIRIIVPEDQTAACYYGQGTKWCTASTSAHNMFNTYQRRGPLYIILPKKPIRNGEKYQWHFESKQYMDEADRPSSIIDLVQRYPQLRNIFKEQAEKFSVKALLLDYNQYQDLYKKFKSEFKRRLEIFIGENTKQIALSIVKDVWGEHGQDLRGVVDRDEIYELAWEAFNDYGDSLVSSIINEVGDDVDTFKDADSMYDPLTGLIHDWCTEQDFYTAIVEALDEVNEDAAMDASYTIAGDIVDWLGSAINQIANELL